MRTSPLVAFVVAILLMASACSSTSSNVETVRPDVTSSSVTASSAKPVTTELETTVPETTVLVDEASVAECAELSDGARLVHPSDADTPEVDLDGDGVGDEFWLTDDPEATPWAGTLQVVGSLDGSVSKPVQSGLWDFDGVLAGSDLDGDGREEVFYSLGGNTSLTATILELEDCELRTVLVDDEQLSWDAGLSMLVFTHFAGGNSCAPTGCVHTVTCRSIDGVTHIELIEMYPIDNVLGVDFDESIPDAEREVQFNRTVFTVADGEAVVLEKEAAVARLAELEDRVGRPNEFDCV